MTIRGGRADAARVAMANKRADRATTDEDKDAALDDAIRAGQHARGMSPEERAEFVKTYRQARG